MTYWNEHGEHLTGGGWIFMALGMIALVVLVVVLVMWMLSRLRPAGQAAVTPGFSAREALDHRLVNGQITSDEYDALRRKLEMPIGGSTESESPAPPAQA